MELKLRKTGDIHIIDVQGDMDLYNSYKLKDLARKVFQNNSGSIIINLEEVNYIDSSGIGAFIHVYSTAKKMNIEMVFANIHGSVKKVIDLTKLTGFFPMADTIDDAIKIIRH